MRGITYISLVISALHHALVKHRTTGFCLVACALGLLWSVGTRAQYTSVAQFAKERGIQNLPGYDMRPIHFGFLLGFNMLDYHVYNTGLRTMENGGVARYAEVTKLDPGLVLGIVTDFRICRNLNFRILPGISFGARNLLFVDEYGNPIDEEPSKIKSTFVECPLLLKYGAKRLHNFRPYVVGGITPRFDLAKDRQEHLNMRSLDIYADAGVGLDFYLTYFRFSIELRGDFGLTNVFDDVRSSDEEDVPYQQAIRSLKSRWWGIVLYFE